MYPILFELGPIQIYTYGVCLALAFYFAVQWSVKMGKLRGVSEEKVLNLAIVSILSAILGARGTYVVVYWHQFDGNLLEIIKVWNGGLVFYGGLIGGVTGGVIYWWLKKESVLAMGDVAAMSISLGQGIGRIGCYFYGCCYGMIMDPGSQFACLGVQFPGQEVLRHNTQIYSSLANFIIFALLIMIFMQRVKPGMVIIAYCYLYGVFRFCIEIIRDDPRGTILGVESLSTSQTISILAILAGMILHIYLKFSEDRGQYGNSPDF